MLLRNIKAIKTIYMFQLELYSQQMGEVLKLCFEVHKTIGGGMLEPIYQECLEYEFQKNNIPYEREKVLSLQYKDIILEKTYKADFLCYDNIVLELKSVYDLSSEHRFQLYNYLRITKKPVGILVNFGVEGLQFEKYGYNHSNNKVFMISRYGIED